MSWTTMLTLSALAGIFAAVVVWLQEGPPAGPPPEVAATRAAGAEGR
ncbi:MAG: hypothetical protein JNK30_10170 [Phenylobacterium sp.]|nr:hypothetical protein [Phenylobacterium sp.]MBL8771735.1 hypothetical protein [Phenylobacterium sp.]